MFRRSKTEAEALSDSASARGATATGGGRVVAGSGKGRPTPTRRDAEAAARERARSGQNKKAARRLTRERQTERNQKMRQGLRTGDERYLPARDRGPVRRAVRDFVDGRLSMAEFLLPLLIVVMISQGISAEFSSGLWSVTILLTVVDSVLLVWRLRRELRTRFPEEPHKGVVVYALLRAMQLRFLRLPKPQVGLGGRPRKRA